MDEGTIRALGAFFGGGLTVFIAAVGAWWIKNRKSKDASAALAQKVAAATQKAANEAQADVRQAKQDGFEFLEEHFRARITALQKSHNQVVRHLGRVQEEYLALQTKHFTLQERYVEREAECEAMRSRIEELEGRAT